MYIFWYDKIKLTSNEMRILSIDFFYQYNENCFLEYNISFLLLLASCYDWKSVKEREWKEKKGHRIEIKTKSTKR